MLKIEYVPIDSIEPYEGNAKLHPAEQIEQIKESILKFGFNDPIAVWKDGKIIEGHGRLIAAHELNLEQVPIIQLDELTDEQRRAYILVHNKLTMASGFDEDLLMLELESISDIDMEQFGFDIDDFAPDLDDDGYYGDERERTNDAYNLDIANDTASTDDFWQMPIIRCDDYIPDRLIGFNYAKSSKEKDTGVHFYIDDYQFERVWSYPEKYLDILLPYDCILSPDFSLYMDMPMPMKIWNVYRSRQIGAYYQSKGIKVIPTISWAEPETYEFCFRGIPKNGIVSISTVGVKRDKKAVETWKDGVRAMIEAIAPKTILVYGGALDYDYGDVDVRYYDNEVTKNWNGSV